MRVGQIAVCRAAILACDSCRGNFPLSLIARRKLTVQTPLPSWQRIRAHDLAPNCIFAEPFCDPRYFLHIWSSTFPSCTRAFIRSFIRSFGKKAMTRLLRRDHLAGLHAHPVCSHASIYKLKRLNVQLLGFEILILINLIALLFN